MTIQQANYNSVGVKNPPVSLVWDCSKRYALLFLPENDIT